MNTDIDIDCVVIGVNSEKTLGRCLRSIEDAASVGIHIRIYYVDGGSMDASVDIAESFDGVHVTRLNPDYPTPGLGRNAGWKTGKSEFIQFLDSDTVIHPDWLMTAIKQFRPDIAAIRGNIIEMHPEASVYNWIGSLEWNTISGECEAFGGNVLIRRIVLDQTGGFNERLVGGEEAELSRRIRAGGWKILHIDTPMVYHDLGMTTFRQYWKRAFRSGYGFAATPALTLSDPSIENLKAFVRIIIRGGGGLIFLLAGLAGILLSPWSLALLLPAVFLLFSPRIRQVENFKITKGLTDEEAKRYAWHCSFVVLPQFFGICRYYWGVLTGKPLRNQKSHLKTRQSKP